MYQNLKIDFYFRVFIQKIVKMVHKDYDIINEFNGEFDLLIDAVAHLCDLVDHASQ